MRKKLIRVFAVLAAFALLMPVSPITADVSDVSPDISDDDTAADEEISLRTEGEVIASMLTAGENDRFVFYYSEDEDLLALKNKKNGSIWWSSPINSGCDPVAKPMVKNELGSSLILTYGTPSDRTVSTLRSARNGKMSYKVSKNTLEVTYRFPAAGIVIPVKYTLCEDFLSVSADTATIKENKRGEEDEKLLLTLSLLPNMLSAGSDEDGYYIIPDGSGAVIDFNNGKKDTRPYSAPIYGSDITAVPLNKPASAQQVYLPVYASVKSNGNGMLAVVHDGDTNAFIEASVSGLSKSSYNKCSSGFTVRSTDTYYMNSEPLTVFENGDISADKLELRFYPMTDKKLDFVDAAAVYREYLTEEKGVGKINNDMPLCIDLYGGTEKKEPVLGIPVTRKKSVTSFEEVRLITDTLLENGADNIILTLDNWTDDGIKGRVDTAQSPSSVLGSQKEFEDMKKYFSEKGVRFYPVSENRTFKSGNGYYSFTDTAMRASGQYSKQLHYNLAYGTQDGMKKPESLLDPSVFPDVFSKLSENGSKNGLEGICTGDMTTVLYGSYGKEKISRACAAEYITEGLEKCRDEIGSVMAEGANAYVFGSVDYISDVPLCSSGYDIFDRDIPFYQLVLHGLIPYSSAPVNADADPEKQFLMSIAAGSGVHFDMVYEDISELKDTEYDRLFYADCRYWTGTAAAEYRFLKDVLSDVADADITEYSVSGEKIKTEYGGVTEIIVNLDDASVEKDGKVYHLADYLDTEGGQVY
ncbi:MAG: hypothetical protein E7505_05520 [Ruminococcus sp.]|nr:hypothetical protein [Ruminococcus sp.]